MSEKRATVKVLLDAKLVEQVDFHRRVVGVQGKKVLLTEPTPEGTSDWLLRDSGIPGFALRVSSGAKTFIVQRKMGGSTSVKRTLGSWPTLSVEVARKRAPIWLGLMADGKDPLHERQERQKATKSRQDAARQTLGWAFEAYMTAKASRAKPTTKADQAKVVKWMERSPLWRTPIQDIDSDTVDRTITPLFERARNPALPRPTWGGPTKPGVATARKIVRYLNAAYNRHVGKSGGAKHSPFSFYMADKQWEQVKPKESFLRTDTELGAAWLRALVARRQHPADHYRVLVDYVLCCVLWGGRKRETQLLQWDDVDFETKAVRFKAETTKSSREHSFPLTPWAEEILVSRRDDNATWRSDSPFVFPSRHHGKSIADARAVLEDLKEETGLWVVLHDLRRTLGTDIAELEDGDMFLVSVALNHSVQGATQRYIKKRVDLLRPLYLAREERLRTIVGLPVASSRSKGVPVDVAQFAARLARDKTLEKAFWKAWGAEQAKGG